MYISMLTDWVFDCYIYLLQAALPFAIVFGLGNYLVEVILRAAFSGKLKL